MSYCVKCRGLRCSCGLEYSQLSSSERADEKKMAPLRAQLTSAREEIERLKAERDEFKGYRDALEDSGFRLRDACLEAQKERDSLKAENEALRKEFKAMANLHESALKLCSSVTSERDSLQTRLDAAMRVVEAARHLLRNYLKDSQYPENITFNERIVKPLREAVVAVDRLAALGDERKGEK